MLNPIDFLHLIYKHYKVLGSAGISLLIKRFIFRGRLIKIKVRDYPQPIYLRNNTSDITVFYQIFLEKSYSIAYTCQPETIIDCGANIGLSSIFFSLKFPNARIIAIEPELSNYELLLKNTNSISNIVVLNAGIWNKPTALKIENSDNSKWEIQVSETSDLTEKSISAVSIQELMNKYKFLEIDILKVDIEGSEKELFETNYETWIPSTRIMIIELHDNLRKGASKSFFKAMSNYDFKMVKKKENLIFYLE